MQMLPLLNRTLIRNYFKPLRLQELIQMQLFKVSYINLLQVSSLLHTLLYSNQNYHTI